MEVAEPWQNGLPCGQTVSQEQSKQPVDSGPEAFLPKGCCPLGLDGQPALQLLTPTDWWAGAGATLGTLGSLRSRCQQGQFLQMPCSILAPVPLTPGLQRLVSWDLTEHSHWGPRLQR